MSMENIKVIRSMLMRDHMTKHRKITAHDREVDRRNARKARREKEHKRHRKAYA